MKSMKSKVGKASSFLKQLSHPHRLLVLCVLSQGERSVSELIDSVRVSQTAMSNYLAQLRIEGLVDFRREHRTLYYYIKNPDVMRIIGLLHDMYCKK